jgi:hypothetical protein
MLQPAGKGKHGCLEVVSLVDQASRAGDAAAGPGEDKLVGVMGVMEEQRISDVAEGPARERQQADTHGERASR